MEKVEFDELLINIKSTRNVNEIKQKLDREKWNDLKKKEKELKKNKRIKAKKRPLFHHKDEEEVVNELEEAFEKQEMDRKRNKVLAAPIHRQAQERIEGKLAYRQTRNELHQWQPIVNNLRVAEQLQFPENERNVDNPLKEQTADERAKEFVPRNELERKVVDVLGISKWNIRNDEEFSQAEREILNTLELKEARRKCQELRKMRALMTFHAAKQKRQSKIKSKTFHRIRKRQERREIVKEIGTLLVENPTKANERIEQLERDRAYERATLKHRGTNKWTKQVRQFASRDPELRKKVEDQLRFGRELKGSQGVKGCQDSGDSSANENEGDDGKDNLLNPEKLVQLSMDEADRAQKDDKPLHKTSENPFYRSAFENIRRERKELVKKAKQCATQEMERISTNLKNNDIPKNEEKQQEPEFLDLNLRQIVQIPAELADGADSDTDIQHAFLMEAYEDDDVLAEFDIRKKRIEEEEAPKEKTNSRAAMRGWGSWTGPAISFEKEKRRIDSLLGVQPNKRKIRALKRKDAQMRGLIIREQVSDGIQKLQPKDVPFPFTRIQDFEAYIQQPLGRDWNTPVAVKQLTKPMIKTKSGQIIRPLNKGLKLERNRTIEIIGEEK